jgi:hypothetical protein
MAMAVTTQFFLKKAANFFWKGKRAEAKSGIDGAMPSAMGATDGTVGAIAGATGMAGGVM